MHFNPNESFHVFLTIYYLKKTYFCIKLRIMNRRHFLRNGLWVSAGLSMFQNLSAQKQNKSNQGAKNIIFMVSDGMSSGTLAMADIYKQRIFGKGSEWLDLYRNQLVTRGLMDMASANHIVTDSAAASSSWGSGFRVKNGRLNIDEKGNALLPIWQKLKRKSMQVGCVTTVPIAHATPAGFCVAQKSRNSMDDIALQYLDFKFDVMMGGGNSNFDPKSRKDGIDVYSKYLSSGYQVVKNKEAMLQAKHDKPILGVFAEEGLPYTIDRTHSPSLNKDVPTLAEMTKKAIQALKNSPNGFALQVEAGKVDWAAHANDIGALLFDQLDFDEAIKVAIDFAIEDKNTLVIITSDHGNANPGLVYGKNDNDHFDNLQHFKMTNEMLLNQIDSKMSVKQIQELVEMANKNAISQEAASKILSYYTGTALEKEGGLYNHKKLPFEFLAKTQKEYTSVGWIGNDHSSDYTELAMFGPGSEKLKPFVKNTDLHYFILDTLGIENKF